MPRKLYNPTKDEVYKAIRAFNERLRMARKHYGEDSTIVKLMKDRATHMLGLEWTPTQGISKGAKNLAAITYHNWLTFKRYIIENNVDYFMHRMMTPDERERIKKNYKGAARYAETERVLTEIKFYKDMYDKIYSDMYDAGYDTDECNVIWELEQTGLYNDLVDLYDAGALDIDSYVDEVYNRRAGKPFGYRWNQITKKDDDDDDEPIDYSAFIKK